MPERLAGRIISEVCRDGIMLPIDIESVIKHYGVHIEWAGLFANKIGLYIPGAEPIIVCKRMNDPRRARFTLAHEFYHHLDYIMSPNHNQVRFCRPDVITERQANRFAGAVLMPHGAVINLSRLCRSDWEMASIFNVSLSAMQIRLKELHISRSISA